MFRSLHSRVLVLVGGTMITAAGTALVMQYRHYVDKLREQSRAEVNALAGIFAKNLAEVGLEDGAKLQADVQFVLRTHPKVSNLVVFDLGAETLAASRPDQIGRRTHREDHFQTIKDGANRTSLITDPEGHTSYRTTAAIVATQRGEVIGGFDLTYSLSDYDQLQAHFKRETLENLGLLAAISFIVSLIISAWVSSPLKRLRSALQAVSHGNLFVHLPRGSTREFDDIFDSFNHMASELGTLTGALNELNESLQQEIEERTHAVVMEKERAQIANRAKSEFLANMSHEMRTPLTAILGFTEVILEDAKKQTSADTTVDSAATVHRNSQHLLNLINEILDLSKIESGKLEVMRAECSPLEIVAEVEKLMQIRAHAKDLDLEFRTLGLVPATIHSDPTRVRQVLVNLVGNAIKFTEAGTVTVETSLLEASGEQWMQFDVVDSGIGVDARHVHKLFQPFSQADSTMARVHGGTGLGLAISKRLSNLLGGDVRMLWSSPGEGSRFCATVATGSLDSVQMIRALPETVETAEDNEGQARENVPAQLGYRILLAEDGRDNQRLITLVLAKAGADVQVVDNGRAVIDAVIDANPDGFDLIIMDMQMPTMDGYKATRELRQQGCKTPIVALTAHAMAGDREKCLEAGCNDYATKPIRWRELFEMIHRHAAAEPSGTDEPQLSHSGDS